MKKQKKDESKWVCCVCIEANTHFEAEMIIMDDDVDGRLEYGEGKREKASP